MRVNCLDCKYWDSRKRGYVYASAVKTDRRLFPGLDSRMREFRCKICGTFLYRIITDNEMEKERISDGKKRKIAEDKAKAISKKERLQDA